MEYMKRYTMWLEGKHFDEETKLELKELEGNKGEIEDRFYKDLEFGTGGLRGKIGAGTNRINKYTVSKATQGFSNYIISKGEENKSKGVVIAYDSRYKSKKFAVTSARVLAANGIKAYLFEDLRSTPELSFAVRHLNAAGGLVITASHNPPEYNGYKVYGDDGCQLVPRLANKVIDEINKIKDYDKVLIVDEKEAKSKGVLEVIGSDIDDIYIEKVKDLSLRNDVDKDIKVVYTPLHGTGNMPVTRVLKELGYSNVFVVKEQENPDSNFSTVDYPNPEDPKALKMAIDLGEEIDADLILGTDPDCDRVGAVVKNNDGGYVILNGNQTGALLLDYILKSKREKDNLPNNGVLVKTIVTSELGKVIAKDYGLETIDTLTGFKFIGEKIKEFEDNGDREFVFGYEESFGYLTGTFVRDKDAVIASMLIAEMAAYYKSKGLSLYEGLEDIYKKYGYFVEDLHSLSLEGLEGKKKIDRVMDSFRNNYPSKLGNAKLVKFNDYGESLSYDFDDNKKDDISLPKSNVLKYIFNDNSWYALRPSGTEPKLKIYISSNGDSKDKAMDKVKIIKEEVLSIINGIIAD